MKWPSPFLRKIRTYLSVVTKIRENAPDKANDLRLVSREPQECFWSLKGILRGTTFLISLDQPRTQLYCFKG